MTRRLPVTLVRAALGLFAASACGLAAAGTAAANQVPAPGATPPVAAPVPAPSPVAPAPPAEAAVPTAPALPSAPPPVVATAAPDAQGGPTDHDQVIGRWGIEVRRLNAPRRFPTRCTNPTQSPCDEQVEMSAFSLRRWTSHDYAYSFGVALAAGGGKEREGGATKSLDTYFGIGPTVGASFLLANWKHMAVSAGPQLDAVFFAPSGSGPKSLDFFARGLVEAELHLGFIGLPALSVGVLTGIEGALRVLTSAGELPDTTRSLDWSVGTVGPSSLWGVVTNAFLRFYL